MATTQFDNVYHGSGKLLGMIRFSDAGLGWKPLDEGATVTIPAEQMTAFAWLRVARQFQLKIRLKGTSDQEEGEHVATFENFQRDDHAKLEQVLRECMTSRSRRLRYRRAVGIGAPLMSMNTISGSL